jgi:hypothetical protein
MAVALSDGHARAAMARERRDAKRIARWMLDRAAQARDLRLGVRIGHVDLLCLPPR